MKEDDNKLTFEYKENKEEYTRVLDTCIDIYKNDILALSEYKNSVTNTIISLIITLVAIYLTFTIPGITDALSRIVLGLLNLLHQGIIGIIFAVISILTIILIILIPSFVVWRVVNWVILKVFRGRMEKILLVDDVKHVKKTLDNLYLAKIEPEKWRLIVEKDEDKQGIKEVKVESIETPKKQNSL